MSSHFCRSGETKIRDFIVLLMKVYDRVIGEEPFKVPLYYYYYLLLLVHEWNTVRELYVLE